MKKPDSPIDILQRQADLSRESAKTTREQQAELMQQLEDLEIEATGHEEDAKRFDDAIKLLRPL